MELNYLRYFFEVAKSGSFTEASRRLRISQSALSKSVALLEDREGVKLLERSKKGVSLTAQGNEVYSKCERLFQIVTEIEESCRGKKEVCEGPLPFGASDHVTNYLLVKKLNEMRSVHKKVVPRIFAGTPNDIIELILKNEIEFGLFFTKVTVPGIKYEPLFEVEMAVVCHPKFVEGGKGKVSASTLKSVLQLAGYIGSIKAQYQRHPSRELMDLLSSEPHTITESNSQETQKRLCLEGMGVAYLARFMVEQEINKGLLVELPLKKPLSLPLLLAKRNSRELSYSAKTFLKYLGQ